MIVAILIVLGLLWGSFINALMWRLHEQEDLRQQQGLKKAELHRRLVSMSIIRGRSMCSNCGHRLAAKDLVPVVSWLLLKGRCRYCGQAIPDTPLTEVLTPLLFVVSYLCWPLPLHGLGLYEFLFWLVFLVGFVALAFYDMRWYLLPDRIVWPLVGLAVLELAGALLFFDAAIHDVVFALGGVLVISGLFYVLVQLSKGAWIGGGDVKLGLVLGLLAGTPLRASIVLFVASLSGTLAAAPALLTGRAGRKSYVPFGPFLILGVIVVQLWGSDIVNWYSLLLYSRN